MGGIGWIPLMILSLAAASKGSFIKPEESAELDTPVFQVTASRSMDEPPTITVSFANGVKDELVLEHYKMHEGSIGGCNYLGRLRHNEFSSVAVTGCLNKPGDRMEVTLISGHNINKMFIVDFFGNTELVKNPFGDGAVSRAIKMNRDFDWDRDGDELINPKEEAAAATAKAVTIPSKLKAVVKFGYDKGIKDALGSQEFGTWIEGVFTHTQAHFRHQSLGTEIEFEVQGSPLFKDVVWTADDNIQDARKATNDANLSGVDTTSWWCNRGGGGVAGIAYLGALCTSYGTNLNEYQSTQSAAGFVLAHELGHNFGMNHDFAAVHGGNSGPCNKKGIMSYGSFSYDQWSSCSKSDWEKHYSEEGWGNGCLDDISDGGNEVCVDMKLTTGYYPGEVSWTFGSCSSVEGGYYFYAHNYTETCCLPPGDYTLTCKDSYGDGWNGGFIEIEGKKYCGDFEDDSETTQVTIGGGDGGTASSTTETPSAECGVKPASIVGGSEVTPYSLPWQVALVRTGGSRSFCGGTLIDDRHVLTAAHCTGIGASGMEVIVGEHKISSSEDGTRHSVCRVVNHPNYNNPVRLNNDFSILHLSKPVDIGTRAVPACLAQPSMGGDALVGKTLVVSGWGTTSSGGSQATVLHSVNVPGVTNEICNEAYGKIQSAMLCAGKAEGGVDSCQGDSGGPLTYTTGGRTYLVGVVSWGIGCAWPGKYGVYARVSEELDWINGQLNETC